MSQQNKPIHSFPSKAAPKKRSKKDNSWKDRYKEAYYTYQKKEYPSVVEIGGMALIKSYPNVGTHKGFEQASYNYIRWIGGATTDTPTTGTPRFETQLIAGKGVKVQVGWQRAKGGQGKSDHDVIYNGVNFKLEFKVGNDYQKNEQAKYQKRIEKAGGKYFIIRTMLELYAIIDWIDQHGNLNYFNIDNSKLF